MPSHAYVSQIILMHMIGIQHISELNKCQNKDSKILIMRKGIGNISVQHKEGVDHFAKDLVTGLESAESGRSHRDMQMRRRNRE